MTRVAVVTMVTHNGWAPLAEVTLPSQQAYANRVGANHVLIDRREHIHPHYDKWQIHSLLPLYDRVLYMDADVVVRADCPNLFDIVPAECVGGQDELPLYPAVAEHFGEFARRLTLTPVPCPFYLNAGLFLVSSAHRDLFREPEILLNDLPFPEQSHFNFRIITGGVPVCLLPSAFNDRYRHGDYLRRSFILHYCGIPMPLRLESAKRDLAAWRCLFGATE